MTGMASYIGQPVFMGDPSILGVEADELRAKEDDRSRYSSVLGNRQLSGIQEVPIGGFQLGDMSGAELEEPQARVRRSSRKAASRRA